jgi:hypothetical protein
MLATIGKTLLVLGLVANAAMATEKPATQVDFNKMIDQNNTTRTELHKGLDGQAAKLPAKDATEERLKVIDFVDVEVGWGEAPPVVDRRYDSVSEPRIVNLN